MKKYILLFCLVIAGLSSCKKSSDDVPFDAAAQAAADETAIKAYIAQYNLPATRDASGLYYQIITPGDDAHPTLNSGVTVNYVARLLATQTVIESSSSSNFTPLSGLIDGWKIGIPKIGKGGKILLLIPSGLAYKNQDQGKIPANSPLIYEITLQGFTN